MAYPDFSKPYILHTDASEEGLVAVLYQEKAGAFRVIAYGSRTLSPAEKSYHLHSGIDACPFSTQPAKQHCFPQTENVH